MLKLLIATVISGFVFTHSVLAGNKTETGPDGLHLQSWFHPSAGDTGADLQAAAAAGKNLIVLFEQTGCYYCGLMHNKNFANPEVVKLINDNFVVIQMDLRGGDIVTGFDGDQLSEAQLAHKWGVGTTPTTVVFNAEIAIPAPYKQVEIFRLPGYLETFEYFSVLDYFASGAYETQGIKAFIGAKKADFEARGIDPKSW